MSDSESKFQFKSIKHRNIRQRRCPSDEEASQEKDDVAVEQSKLELIHETKEKQKLRTRPQGVNV